MVVWGSVPGLALQVWAAFELGSACYAWRVARSRGRGAGPIPAGRVVLVRPCAGDEPGLEARLAELPDDAPRVTLAVRFAVSSELDPAAILATRAANVLLARGVDARVLFTGAGGPNNKAHQLDVVLSAEGTASAWIVVADSDVELRRVTLEALLGPLGDPRVAAVWAPPVETRPSTLADRASAAVLDASLHGFALLGALDARTMVGKLFAVRADALAAAGGFGALTSYLGEDAELARRLRALGHRVCVSSALAPSSASGRSASAVLARYARWLWVVRAQRPALLLSYPLFLAPLPAMILLALASRGEGLALALCSRGAVAALARSASRRPPRWLSLWADILLAEALLLAALLRTLTARRLRWRGAPLRITREGLLRREPK